MGVSIMENCSNDLPFKDLIGYSGSLKEIVKKCQESIVYPRMAQSLLLVRVVLVKFLARNIYNEAKNYK